MIGTPLPRRQFGSDNFAGICPEAWAALAEANVGHAESYGNDLWTDNACRLIREVLETDCEAFYVFNGTSANSLALAALCRSYDAVFCHRMAHVEVDECGAPGFFSGGAMLITLPGEDGKLTPATLERGATSRHDMHFPRARAVTLTQATEVGTVYTPAEIRALTDTARRLGLKVHMDGARFANAVVSLGCQPKEITWQAGVDVLSFGATKNGVSVGEAVVFFDRDLAAEFDYRLKQSGQLASKMRFLAAPWVGILRDGAWLRHARQANAMAQRLAAGLRGLPGVSLAYACQANAVFVQLSDAVAQTLQKQGWIFYQMHGEVDYRFMCAWDTTEADVDAFLQDVREATATA
jgi:threonine aldolase